MNQPFSFDPDFISVAPEEEGFRIDKLLAGRFPHCSRTYFQSLIENGSVLINGQPVKKREIPKIGDEIEVCFQLTPELSVSPEPMAFEILFEDDHIIAINKPPGLVVHPAPGHWTGTFVNGLLAHCRNLPQTGDPLRPGIVHRLDKDTSGILIAAKTREAHQKLIELFASRKIEKHYLAVCCGRPPNGPINAPIGRHPVKRKEMAIVPEGKEALSYIQVLAFNDKASLALIRPMTGRTHQIRVHLKHLGHPILGDEVYGNPRMNQSLAPGRLLLHAYRLTFDHPCTGEKLQLMAPIPTDIRNWMKGLCGPSLCEPALSRAEDLQKAGSP
ncbi:MAG: RluA family pseudouridine synthase [Verrucomicrobia bacterium]|nr:RluA family pseudouridine synthase [Verrucomicrobiota bacterium]